MEVNFSLDPLNRSVAFLVTCLQRQRMQTSFFAAIVSPHFPHPKSNSFFIDICGYSFFQQFVRLFLSLTRSIASYRIEGLNVSYKQCSHGELSSTVV